MNHVVLTLLEATLTLYPADANDQPVLTAPIWMGVQAENLQVREQWLKLKLRPTGRRFPKNHPLVPEYEISIARVWALPLADLTGFNPARGRFVLDVVWRDEEAPNAWHRETFYGVTISDRSRDSREADREFVDRQVFDAEFYTTATGQGTVPALTTGLPLTVRYVSATENLLLYTYDAATANFTSVASTTNRATLTYTPADKSGTFDIAFAGEEGACAQLLATGTFEAGTFVQGAPGVEDLPRMDWYRGAERVASVSRLGKVFAPAFTEGIATGLNEAQFALYGAAMVRASISTTGMTATAFKAYLPSDASALKLWVESDKLTLADGANVLTWPDLSGNGDLISVGSAHPVYRSVLADPRDLSTGQPFADNGLPVVEWPRPNITPLRRMEGGTLNPQTHCVFCVVMPWYLERITGGNTIAHELVNALPLAGDDNGFAMSIPFGVPYHPLRGLFNSAGNSAMATGATTVYPPAAPKWILAEQEVNAANLVVKLDGVVQASAAINLPTIANDCTIRVGAAAMSNTQFGGYMRCVLVYEGALTGHQRTKIRNYLRRNYGPF